MDEDEAHVIEAKGGAGVLVSDIADFSARYHSIEYRQIDGDLNRARSLIGKPFDNKGIKGVFFRSFNHCPESWFCSELVAYCTTFIPDEYSQYQTPETLYRLSKPCVEQVSEVTEAAI
ncbi:hypothetical protein [Alteromonas lipolytica]|uniref:hypothetical protein n=1 Tax=Alteromonas lipolytica TaxID=1856405 RepID=UPI001E30C780|nr:hypothetical protein [Alteromonas lipolytica]